MKKKLKKIIEWSKFIEKKYKIFLILFYKNINNIFQNGIIKIFFLLNKKYNIIWKINIFIFMLVFLYKKMWLLDRFIYFIIVLFFLIVYSIIIRYFGKNNMFEKKKEFFKRHKYINILGLFIYKWSHIYFWWLELKIMIINVLKILRYFSIKLGLEKKFRKLDEFMYILIYIIIEKIFYNIIKYITDIKSKILYARKKDLIEWRLIVYIWITYLYMLGIKFEYLLIIILIYWIIKIYYSIIEEFIIYFTDEYCYNLYDNRIFNADSIMIGGGLIYKGDCFSKILFRRFILDGLYVKENIIKEDVYKFKILANLTYFDNWYKINEKSFKKYCIIEKENLYWYKNEYFFKDVMGGLKLVYIMNYCYILRDILFRVVHYRDLIEDLVINKEDWLEVLKYIEYKGNIENVYKDFVFMLDNYEKLLKECKNFFELISNEEINNGQKYKFELVMLSNLFGNSHGCWIKVGLEIDNSGIKTINNKKGNEKMLEEFVKLRNEAVKIKNKENELIESNIFTELSTEYLNVRKFKYPIDEEDEKDEKFMKNIKEGPGDFVIKIVDEFKLFVGEDGEFLFIQDHK